LDEHRNETNRAEPPVVVAVVSWNTRELLDRCLASLRPAAEAGLAAVWVVDNASADGSPDMVRERHPWATLVASRENLGYGAAINLVAARTSSPWLVASNADVAVRPGALERLVAAAERDPGAGLVAPRLLLPDGTTQHSVWPFPTAYVHVMANLAPRLRPRGVGDRLALHGSWDPERTRRVPWAIGAFLLIRRSAWDALGGFAPDQWMSAEDVDLGWRAREAGWATLYVADAVVDHDESAAAGQRWGDDLAVHWQRCSYSWMERRFGRRRAVVVGLINLAGAVARVPPYEVLALLRPEPWAWRARMHRRWTRVHLYAFAPRRVLARYR
jgi:GT2 family glycosyltransferase